MAVTVNVNLLMSDERRQEIREAAARRETNVSAWIREAIREKLEREKVNT